MNPKKFRDQILKGEMTRRDVHRALAAAGIGVATVPMLNGRVLGAEDVITYFTWSGYEDPTFHAAFKEKYGEMPNFSFFAEEEEALQKMRAGFEPNMAHPCSYSVPRWRRAGVLDPIDTSRLSNYGDVWPKLQELEVAHHDGNVYFVPFDWGNSSVLFRTDLVDEKYQEEHTWSIMWDERYQGRLAMYDSVDGAVIVAGLMNDAEDPFNMTDEELARVRESMSKQAKLMRFYWGDNTTMEQGLASGELVAAYAWNEAALRLKEQGLPVEYMNPKEGILCWVCGLSVVKGNGDNQQVYDMINGMLDPEVGKYMLEAWGYGHSNRKSFDLVDQEVLAARGLASPSDLFEQGVFLKEIPDERRAAYEQMFNEVKAGF